LRVFEIETCTGMGLQDTRRTRLKTDEDGS